jgi:hypothetical protein
MIDGMDGREQRTLMMRFSELIPQPLLLTKRRGAFGEPTSLSKFREGPQGEFG